MKNSWSWVVVLFVCYGCSEDAKNESVEEDLNESTDIAEVVAKVAIPDAAFEQALVDLNFDDAVDGEVQKSRIDFITELNINNKGISDLSGISEFKALVNLNVRDNNLTALDVTDNTDLLFVWGEGNQLESVNVNGLSSLEKLGLDRNRLDELVVDTNTSLQLLTLSENQLSSIDISNNNALTDFTVVNNPLNCILVNQSQLDNIPVDWVKDEADNYSVNCE